MMVIFLCGLVFLILIRTVKNDFAKYAREEEEAEPGLSDESGWKQLHGDVFREPPSLMLYAALYGTGWQLAVLAFGVILFASLGRFHGEVYEERGEMTQSLLATYALTSVVAGYSSGSYYRQFFNTPRRELQDSRWQQTMIFTILLFPCIIVGIVSCLNMVAMYYQTSNVLSFTVLLKLMGIWMFISFPLAVLGTLFGRHWGGKNTFPCRVNTYPRDLPEAAPWFAQWYFVIPATGLLPFGSIFIEMYFIFTSFWNYKFYYVYGLMLVVYLILTVVTVCTTVVAVYFVLNAENHKWQWLSFNAAGSTAFYVFCYAVYYYYFKTNMQGFLQWAFYFGYTTVFCVGLFILCGTVGSAGAMTFVKTIFRNIKVD
uniref:Transmembrane 9 superfamily member n=2 Tax=Phaeomonas parva TaxID=124430 RepID=A0A7S1XWF6_9STRA|mmetsp:Transcript_43786/g.137506  ORF Transcript_43786/g.137506 Transcript_43786/m.137506 type:complete len:371 (+) Transcript_43786:864-1976(+)